MPAHGPPSVPKILSGGSSRQGARHEPVLAHAPACDHARTEALGRGLDEHARHRGAGRREHLERFRRIAVERVGVGEVGDEGGRPDGERDLLVVDDAGRRRRVPDVLQHGPRAEPDRHQESVEVPGLVGERGSHEDHGVRVEGEAGGADPHACGEGVAGVHHPLRLARGSRGVANLDHLVRVDAPLVEERPRVDLVLPALVHEGRLEGVARLRRRGRTRARGRGASRAGPRSSARTRTPGRRAG